MSTGNVRTLPDEILAIIFAFAPSATLFQASLVCRRFNDIIHPMLYRHISMHIIPARTSNTSSYEHMPSNVHKFERLIDTLSARPTLREKVISLSLEVWYHPWYQRFECQNRLVALLPHLNSLYLRPPPVDLDLSGHPLLDTLRFDFGDFSGEHEGISPSREELSTLEFLSWHIWYPSLRSLCVQKFLFSGDRRISLFPTDIYRSSCITDLKLEAYDGTDIGALPGLLQSIKALQNFTFEIVFDWECEHMIEHGVSPGAIGRAILYHAATLVHLAVACSNAAAFSPSTTIGRLDQFPRLKHLGIPETLLTDPHDGNLDDSFPPSLEFLQLQYPMGLNQGNDTKRNRRIARVKRLADQKASRLPSLQHVVWWDQQAESWAGTTYGPSSDIHDVRQRYQSIGVRFTYRNASNYEDTPLGGNVYGSVDGIESQYLNSSKDVRKWSEEW